MSFRLQAALASACVLFSLSVATSAAAQEPIAPEEIGVETTIKPGPNIYVLMSAWDGAGAVNVLSADDLSYKGNVTTGMTGQFALGAKADVVFTASAFPKRIVYGPVEAVFQKSDISTLKTQQEIIVPPKLAQAAAAQGMIQVSADGRRAVLQNATPATSVTILDLEKGAVVDEVPIPGCFSIILSTDAKRFTSICGDGTLLSVRLGDNGKAISQASSDKIFDVDADPLFIHTQRVNGDLVFLSYSGVFYRVSDKGDKAKLLDRYAFTEGVAGDWAPGGYEVIAYNEPNGVMFVTMHSGAEDGSHKNGSEEIWAVDPIKKKLMYRSAAKGLTHIAVNQSKTMPLVFGIDSHDGKIQRYEVDPTARFAAKLTHEIELPEPGFVVAAP